MSWAQAGALANIDIRQVVLTRYLADEQIPAIAASLGVHRSALNYQLLKQCPDEWRDVQAARAITSLEKAKEKMESAVEALDVARAREQIRTAQWELERVLKRIYGNQVAVTGADGGPVQHQMSVQVVFVEPGKVIDAERTDDLPSLP